jgi:hypothetical protein
MCNAFRHPSGCTCGWGGEGHLGRRDDGYFGNYITYPSTAEYLWRGSQRNATYDSYVNPNARCPVCRADVYFYQSPYGGRVFFDDLGPPWPKHPCTDNSGSHKYLKVNSARASPPRTYKWQLDGWDPFICLAIRKDQTGRTEIEGRIVRNLGEGATNGHLVFAYAKGPYKTLGDVPLFIREIDRAVGKYEIATYNLSPHGFQVEPVFVSVYVPSPWRPAPDHPEQSDWVVATQSRTKHREKKRKANELQKASVKSVKELAVNPVDVGSKKKKPKIVELVNCPVCNCRLRKTRLSKHLHKIHPSQNTEDLSSLRMRGIPRAASIGQNDSLKEDEFKGQLMNLIYVKRREEDALKAAGELGKFGAEIALIAVKDDSANLPHLGRIYYFHQTGGDHQTASRIAQVVRSIERVGAAPGTLDRPPGKPYSLWIVK